MNKRRLLKLANLLEADAKNKKGVKFNLCVVGTTRGEGAPMLDCGTEACAMGLAALSGTFKRAGLSYKVRGSGIDTTINNRRMPYYSAAKKIFDVSIRDAHFLFSPIQYPSEKQMAAVGERYVAQRIRDFVAGKVSAA